MVGVFFILHPISSMINSLPVFPPTSTPDLAESLPFLGALLVLFTALPSILAKTVDKIQSGSFIISRSYYWTMWFYHKGGLDKVPSFRENLNKFESVSDDKMFLEFHCRKVKRPAKSKDPQT